MDKAGLTQAEMIEYKITPPSYHSINEAINKDIAKLRDHRWPYTKGGRKPVMPTPVPDSMKTRPAKEPSLTVAARSNPLLSFALLSFPFLFLRIQSRHHPFVDVDPSPCLALFPHRAPFGVDPKRVSVFGTSFCTFARDLLKARCFLCAGLGSLRSRRSRGKRSRHAERQKKLCSR